MPGSPEQRYLLALAHQAGPDPRIQKGADGARDFFTETELEKAAWSFMQGPREIGLFHADGTVGHATAVESYVWRGEPWQIGDVVVKSGDWLLGLVCDDVAWDLYKSGRVTGVSMQGTARRRTPAAA